MTSSDCVLGEGSGCPTSAGKFEREDNIGGEVKCEVRRSHEKSQAEAARQRTGVHGGAGKSAESRAVAAEGHSTHDRGSGCIVGGELDVTTTANETE